MIFLFALGIATYAAIYDLKTTEIPSEAPALIAALGGSYALFASLAFGDLSYLANAIWNTFWLGLIGFLLFKLGQWGDGDAALLASLGLVLPSNLSWIALLLNVILVGAAYSLGYTLFLAVRNRRARQALRHEFSRSPLFVLMLCLVLISTLMLVHTPLLNFQLVLISLGVLLFSLSIFLYRFGKLIERTCLLRRIPTSALKPGDVLKAMNGKTIEVISTDAEGRLILADALSYAQRLGLSPLIDLATLTGACRIALGTLYSGLFSNDQDLADKILRAAERTGERIWQMPMPEEYKEQNKSEIANVKNTGNRYGGAITAALFLAEFVDNTPWAHLDIAGTASSNKESGYTVKGATGVGVRTLVELALNAAEGQETT